MMTHEHGADTIKLTLVENFMHRMTTEQLSSCMCCGLQLQTLFLIPCGCQICTECVTSQTTSCPACHTEFDVDDFQRLQPGLEYNWKWNIVEDQKKREQARMLAEALDETRQRETGNQHQGEVDNVNRNVNNTRRRFRKNQPHVCEYSSAYADGKCKLCGELHLCTLIESQECNICNCKAEDCPEEESKAYYITNKLIKLLAMYQNRGTHDLTGEAKRPLKVIIFTQFQQVSNLVGDRLIRRFGRGCVAEYWGHTKNIELTRFTKTVDCFCMLLNKDGSHGLNLSFVTHIFFLDEILGKSQI
jgi:SNF2 family DNA or RNA helicase